MKFDKKYEKLMEQYSLNEGLFSNIGNAFKKAITSPFEDKKFNPFFDDSIDTKEKEDKRETKQQDAVKSTLENEMLDVNKKIEFSYIDDNNINQNVILPYSKFLEKNNSLVKYLKNKIQNIDINTLISVDSKRNVLNDKIKEVNKTKKLNIDSDKTYNKILNLFKPSRNVNIEDKLIWLYILADPNQNINLQTK